MAYDLLSALPTILPSAIAWAEAQERTAVEAGAPLNAQGIALAKRVGVRQPDRARLRILDTLPLPDEPVLRHAALSTGLLGPGTIGLTLGYAVFIWQVHMSTRLLSHELRPVYQYEAAGSIAAFLPVYLQQSRWSG